MTCWSACHDGSKPELAVAGCVLAVAVNAMRALPLAMLLSMLQQHTISCVISACCWGWSDCAAACVSCWIAVTALFVLKPGSVGHALPVCQPNCPAEPAVVASCLPATSSYAAWAKG